MAVHECAVSGTAHATAQAKAAHARNLSLIVIAVLALFWRVFFLGETLVDVATLNNQLPWGAHTGISSDYPYDRRDLTDMYVTRDYFVVQAYRDGEMPLWNPYTMAGHPIYADGVTRTLSPFLLVYKFLDVPLGYAVARIAELTLGAVFMYLFLIGIGVGPKGSLIGAMIFAFSSHSMFHLTGLGWWGGLMWLPLIMLFVDRAVRRNSYLQALIAGLFLALQFFCGFMANQIYYVGAVVLYYSYFAVIARRRRAGIGSGSVLLMLVVTLLVGFGLSGTQWIPVLELLKYSNRGIVPTQMGYIYLPPWYLATLVFPNIFGTAYDTRTLRGFTALGVSHDHILYLGAAALLPLGFCLFRASGAIRNKFLGKPVWAALRGRPALASPVPADHRGRPSLMSDTGLGLLLLLAAISVVLMTAAPLYVHVTRFVPVLQTIRVVMRAGVLFIFAASALAAIGADQLLEADYGSLAAFFNQAKRFVVIAMAALVCGVICAYAIRTFGFQNDPGGRGRLAFLRRAAAVLSSLLTPPRHEVLLPLAFLLTAFALLGLLVRRKVSPTRFFPCLIVLLLTDLFINSSNFNHSFPAADVFPHTRITDLLAALPPGRLLPTPSDIDLNRSTSEQPAREKIISPPNTLLPYRISTVTGKEQLFPRWYQEFAALVEDEPNMSHIVFDRSQSRFFDLLNVRYVLTHQSAPAPTGCRRIESAEGLSLYENSAAIPRAFFARNVIEVSSEAEAMATLREGGAEGSVADFDPRDSAIVESQAAAYPAPAAGAAELIEDKRNTVRITTRSATGGLLVLSDNYYPGWQASIDGVPAKIFKTNLTMRGVGVPPGNHEILYVFAPRSLAMSFYITLGSGAAIVLCGALLRFYRRNSVERS
jgi:hypothetical protein